MIFRFGFLLRCQDFMNPWVRYKEKGKNRENERKEGENEETELECLKLEFHVDFKSTSALLAHRTRFF